MRVLVARGRACQLRAAWLESGGRVREQLGRPRQCVRETLTEKWSAGAEGTSVTRYGYTLHGETGTRTCDGQHTGAGPRDARRDEPRRGAGVQFVSDAVQKPKENKNWALF